jgi:hypothetical protein
MTERGAQTLTNVLLVSAGAAAAYAVLTKPRLRRVVWGATRLWLGAGVPAYLLAQARDAWRESATPPPVVHRPW